MNYALRHPRFWLFYFVCCAALIAIIFASLFYGALSGKASFNELVSATFGALSMIPLYGYVRQRRVSPRWLWWLVLPISAVGLVVTASAMLFLTLKTGSILQLLGLLLAGFGAPFVFALYQYVHRSPHIWNAT